MKSEKSLVSHMEGCVSFDVQANIMMCKCLTDGATTATHSMAHLWIHGKEWSRVYAMILQRQLMCNSYDSCSRRPYNCACNGMDDASLAVCLVAVWLCGRVAVCLYACVPVCMCAS